MSVALCHYQAVFISLENVSIVQLLVSTAGEVALHFHIDISAPLIHPIKSGCFLLVSVEMDGQGKPESPDLILREGIGIRLKL